MEDRPLFSEMLVDRRRELGLSIKQASNVLRLKEEGLIAFEEGDFDSIPKSGYAQGMLSSYARYLGLNAKTVVNQFSQDLFEHERGAGSHEARRRSRRNRDSADGPLYQTPQANVGQPRRTYVESRGFLPTSGGFAGDMSDFATTSSPRPRYSSSHGDGYDDSYPQGRPYTSRVPLSSNVSPLGTSQRQRPMSRTGYGQQEQYGSYASPSMAQGTYARGYGRHGDVTTRRVMPSQYQDDMLLDNDGESYQSASSMAGRRSSRNIASTQRPNVRRRSGGSSARGRNRTQTPAHGGIVGMIELFLQDRSRMLVLIVAVLTIVLSAVIILSVRSCISSSQSTGRSVTVTSTGESNTEEKASEDVSSEEEQRAREEATAAKVAETEANVSSRVIEVAVADGEVTWLEIAYDGKSDIAETVTGPWNRKYTVTQSITVNVNDTTAVTVMEDGKKLEFDSKASGIGTITVQVSKKGDNTSSTTEGNAAAGTTQTTDGQTTADGQQQGADGQATTDQQTSENPESGEVAQGEQGDSPTVINGEYELAEDGYDYGPDGYMDADGNFYAY